MSTTVTRRPVINVTVTTGNTAEAYNFLIPAEDADQYLTSVFNESDVSVTFEFLIEETTESLNEDGNTEVEYYPATSVELNFDPAEFGITVTQVNDNTFTFTGPYDVVFPGEVFRFVVPDIIELDFNTEQYGIGITQVNANTFTFSEINNVEFIDNKFKFTLLDSSIVELGFNAEEYDINVEQIDDYTFSFFKIYEIEFLDNKFKIVLLSSNIIELPYDTDEEYYSLVEYEPPTTYVVKLEFEFEVDGLTVAISQWIIWSFESAVDRIEYTIPRGKL